MATFRGGYKINNELYYITVNSFGDVVIDAKIEELQNWIKNKLEEVKDEMH